MTGARVSPSAGVGWPVRLTSGPVLLRPLSLGDRAAWSEVRSRNAAWLARWDATVPPGADARPTSYRALVRSLRRQARLGTTFPFAIVVEDRFVGQVTVNNVVRGSAQFGSIGYWLDRDVAGRGIMPRAVAMVIDHCLGPLGLHRVEVAIRPENSNSLRVVEKLGLREYGLAPRYLHIDGEWRDHRLYAVTREELDGSLVARLDETERRG